jgi:hypothetical protein
MQAEQTQRQADERSQELALLRERQAAREAVAEQVSKKNKNTTPALLQCLLVSVVVNGAQISNYSSLKHENKVHAVLKQICVAVGVWVCGCGCACACVRARVYNDIQRGCESARLLGTKKRRPCRNSVMTTCANSAGPCVRE